MKNKEKYKIGTIFETDEDMTLQGMVRTRTIPKGSLGIVGADGFAHMIYPGILFPAKLITNGEEVANEYDTDGIAFYLYKKFLYEFEDYFEDLDMSAEDVRNEISDILMEVL